MARQPLDFKAVLPHHLDHTFEKEAWHPSLVMAVDGVTHAEAAWKPGPNRHSIWPIVRHVTRWKQATMGAHDIYHAGQIRYLRALHHGDRRPSG